MTPPELKDLRESFDFTQKQMADILGIHPNAFQKMEYGTSPIPKYIKNYAMCLTTLNENKLFRKHIAAIGVKLHNFKPGQPCGHPGCCSHVTHPCEICGRIQCGLKEVEY